MNVNDEEFTRRLAVEQASRADPFVDQSEEADDATRKESSRPGKDALRHSIHT